MKFVFDKPTKVFHGLPFGTHDCTYHSCRFHMDSYEYLALKHNDFCVRQVICFGFSPANPEVILFEFSRLNSDSVGCVPKTAVKDKGRRCLLLCI